MNKLTIPAILVATVMVAGMFAFMPVQQASTVHDTIQATTTQIQSVASTTAAFAIDDEDELRISSTDAYQVLAITCTFVDTDSGVGDATAAAPVVTIDGATVTVATNLGDPGASLTAQMQPNGVDWVSDGGADSFVLDWGDITGESGDESIDCTVTFLASGDDTVTAAWTAVGE